MRTVKNKTYWTYTSRGIEREGTLLDLILDMVYFIEVHGVLPPLHVMNEQLKSGGSNGGMGPGTKWRPFKITAAEYEDLAATWKLIDPQAERSRHPYVYFEKPITDETLHNAIDLRDWSSKVFAKYPRSQDPG
jgi:hypothetical protein